MRKKCRDAILWYGRQYGMDVNMVETSYYGVSTIIWCIYPTMII